MRSRLVGVLGLCAAVLVAACGGDDKGYGDPIAVDAATKSQISSLVSSAASVSTVATSPCDGAGLEKMLGLYDSMTVLLNVKLAHKGSSGLADEALATVRDATRARAGAKPATGCVAGTGTVTFDHYSVDGGGTIDGTITFAGGSFTTDLTVTLTTEGSTISMKMKGSLKVSSTSIKGTVTLTASGSFQGGTTFTASFASTYDVTLANSCATDGTIEVHVSENASGNGATAKYDVWAKAEFGPACGEVTIY